MTDNPQQAALKPYRERILALLDKEVAFAEKHLGSYDTEWMKGIRALVMSEPEVSSTPAPVDHAALAEKLETLQSKAYDAFATPYSLERQEKLNTVLARFCDQVAAVSAALRAHPAGGVSDTQKTLQRGGLRELIQEALTAKFDDGREEYLLRHGVIRAGFTQTVNATKNYENRLIEALRAAGIGAGVVENDK